MIRGKRFRLGVSVPKGQCHLLACAAQRGLCRDTLPSRAAAGIPGLLTPQPARQPQPTKVSRASQPKMSPQASCPS